MNIFHVIAPSGEKVRCVRDAHELPNPEDNGHLWEWMPESFREKVAGRFFRGITNLRTHDRQPRRYRGRK